LDAKPPRPAKSAFFDLELDPKRVELTRPSSLLRTTEWGGLTLVSLLVSFAFPPYFVQVLLLASLNAGGLLWVSHLSEAGRKRLRDFEQEFAQGHQMEEEGRWADALKLYQDIAPRYSEYPRIAEIALKQIELLKKRPPEKVLKPDSPQRTKAKPKAKAKRSRR
jgi:hypothetical protein